MASFAQIRARKMNALSAPKAEVKEAVAVEIAYEDLINKDADLTDLIAKGFGSDPDCLGIVIITGLEKEGLGYPEKRETLLKLASEFADLDEDVKMSCVHIQSSYNFGWSHGQEFMNGRPDYAKGSYYNSE
jgi:hypothetical protein